MLFFARINLTTPLRRCVIIEILYIEGTSGPWACPSSRQREKMSRTDHLCPIAHAACPARQRRMVQFIGSLTLAPAGYHGRAHLQRRLYLVPSMYNISMCVTRSQCVSLAPPGAPLKLSFLHSIVWHITLRTFQSNNLRQKFDARLARFGSLSV